MPVERIPQNIRQANWATVWEWVTNLTTDDLQRYGIMQERGADPRLDIPADYPNRAEALEMVFRLGLFMRGVAAAGDQTEWLRANGNREDGALAFVRANSDGPDWGFAPEEGQGGLDEEICTWQPYYYRITYYYLYRTGGKSTGTVIQWSSPVSQENNRRIMVSGEVPTSMPGTDIKLCKMFMKYYSATSADGRLFQDLDVEATRTGYLRGLTSDFGENIRSDGLPRWIRTTHEAQDCFGDGINCNPNGDDCADLGLGQLLQPRNVNPPAKYLLRGAGTARFQDHITTPCSPFECDSCWYLGTDRFPLCQIGSCCSNVPGDDSCFYTTGFHQARVWNHTNFGNDPENYYYTATGNPAYNQALITRRVAYNAGAFVTANGGSYPKGGWMNQVVYAASTTGGPYAYLADDQVKAPDGAQTVNGNSQLISRTININDSALWLGRYLQVGCQPFWQWGMYRSGNVIPYYLQLANAGSSTCGWINGYNNWAIDVNNNPLYCDNGFYAGSVTYPSGWSTVHRPWVIHNQTPGFTDGRGWLHPSQRFLRQVPGWGCPGDTYEATYYPLQSQLANGVNQTLPDYYAGTYLVVYTKPIPW